jgi:hypothetical protein
MQLQCINVFQYSLLSNFILFRAGNSDGQTLIVREGDNGVAYSWNSKEFKWDKVSIFNILTFVSVFWLLWVSTLAYLNLLRTKRLGCC